MIKKNLSDQAYKLIKSKLASYEKGQFISARESAREYEMSYTPMREAFQRLHQEGFLKLVPNVGYFVNSIEVIDVIQIFQVRECMETFVIEKVTPLLTDSDIQMLDEYNSRQQKHLDEKDIWQYLNCDEAFHLRFFAVYGNPHLLKTYKNVREQFKICSNRIANNMSIEVYEEHCKIIEALRARDKPLAISNCREHLEKSKQRIIDGFIRVDV